MSGLHALIYAAFALAGLLQLVAARWLAALVVAVLDVLGVITPNP